MYTASKSTLLLVLRITLGIIFIAHGSQKLFGFFGGPGIDGFINYLASMDVPEWMAYCSMFAEFFGGLSVLLGIATEFGALAMIGNMLGAIYLVHGSNGFFIQNNGYEYALCLIVLAAIVLLAGPGEYSVWDMGKRYRE